MTNKKQLVLFSYEYPFGYSETFLDTEIKILASEFSEIIVIPCRMVWNSNLKYDNLRNLPPNVSIRYQSFSFRYINFPIIFFLLTKVRHFDRLKLYKPIIKQSLKVSILIGFLQREKLINAQSLYYSYWKNECATTLAFLRSKKNVSSAFARAHREDLYEDVLGGGPKPFDNFVNENLEKIFCISQHGLEYLLNKGFSSEKVVLSRLGVSPGNVCTLYSRSCFNILSVSNVVRVKRLDLLAKAVLKLNMNVSWVHIGGGDEFEMLQGIVDTNQNHNISIELLGKQSHEFVYDYYRNNHVNLFLNVSSSEGVPVSIMEAYSFSVPCMACDVGGNNEIIDPDFDFLLPSSIDENALTAALTNFYAHKELWNTFKINAFRIWKEKFNAIDNYKSFSIDLLEGKCS